MSRVIQWPRLWASAAQAIAAWLSGWIFDLTTPEVGLMFSMSIAQAAATLAATIIGLEAGLYGSDIVNAVRVVVAVSLILTSIGTSRFAPQIAPPSEERRRAGEAVLFPTANTEDEDLAAVVRLAGRLTEPVGGVVQPIVVETSTEPGVIERARSELDRANTVLRRAGHDVESDLRIDRSIASGLNRASIQADSSLLLLAWPGPVDVRGYLLGSSYGEIIAATATPVMIAALHPDVEIARQRLALVARDGDFTPGHLPSLRLAADITNTLTHRDRPLVVGPARADAFDGADIELPDHAEFYGGHDDIAGWAARHTEPGDVVILPLRGFALRAAAVSIHESGRSVLAVAQNPMSRSALTGSAMTLPLGGSITPG